MVKTNILEMYRSSRKRMLKNPSKVNVQAHGEVLGLVRVLFPDVEHPDSETALRLEKMDIS